jgi:hypothetical protein
LRRSHVRAEARHHHHPIQTAATSLVDHFVKHYAPAIPDHQFAAALHALHASPGLFHHAAQAAANPVHHLGDAMHALHVNPALFQQAVQAPDGAGRMLQPLPLFHG